MDDRSGYTPSGQAYDAQNKEDYDELTGRIKAGLARIRGERDAKGEYVHKPSPEVLAKLASPCAVSTLYTRKEPVNPIIELKRIKEARRLEEQERIRQGEARKNLRISRDHAKSVDDLVQDNRRLERERNDALDQQAVWSKKYADLKAEHNDALAVNAALGDIVKELEAEVSGLRRDKAALEAEVGRLKAELEAARTGGNIIDMDARRKPGQGDARG